jgi:diadenosine tetraphosphate (Ap4A) HIT family hydrolase
MSKFIKFTNYVLNTNNIYGIAVKPNKYHIHIIGRRLDGYSWSFAGFGFGNLSSHSAEIEICKVEHSADYKILSDWIEKIENNVKSSQ